MLGEEDDDLESITCLYCDGHWEWDNGTAGLKFVSNVVTESHQTVYVPAAVVGPIDFKDNLDVIEQQKFKKRIQRKYEGEDDVVTLQDIKDIVLYTAPSLMVTPLIVSVLHTHTADRFLRALILYCQYYEQISYIMAERKKELETKIPTQRTNDIESEYRQNLTDIRLLVAKEYCTMLIGGCDFKKFHHMGNAKKQKSMPRREAMVFEPLIRLSVQIVWVALGRKNYKQLELEINRLFRSKKFNLVEHNLDVQTTYKMSQREQHVRVGDCVRANRSMMRMRSPFYNEIECVRDVDFRMFGLGVINFSDLSERLQYLENFLIIKEANLQSENISLGIIGLCRSRFDIMLREIKKNIPEERRNSSYSQHSGSSAYRMFLGRSTTSKTSGSSDSKRVLYQPIYLPRTETMPQPMMFPEETRQPLPINQVQRRRWMNRVSKINRRRSVMFPRV